MKHVEEKLLENEKHLEENINANVQQNSVATKKMKTPSSLDSESNTSKLMKQKKEEEVKDEDVKAKEVNLARIQAAKENKKSFHIFTKVRV